MEDWKTKIEILEELDIMHNTKHGREDLNKGYAEYTRWLNMQDSILKQKLKLQWFKNGDRNTKYFYSVLRSRRMRLNI